MLVEKESPEAKEKVPWRSFPGPGSGTSKLTARRLKSKLPNAAPTAVPPNIIAGKTAALRKGVRRSAPKNPTIFLSFIPFPLENMFSDIREAVAVSLFDNITTLLFSNLRWLQF